MTLVAMENALFADPTLDWERRCARIAEAGFAGVYAVPYPLTDEEMPCLAELDAAPTRLGLRLAGVYANIDLALPSQAPWNDRVRLLCETACGVPRVELSFKCSDPVWLPTALDDAIVARLEPLLTLADRRGFDLALYPHSFYPLETIAHAERLAARVAHPRLGVAFATSHCYALRSAEETVAELRACAGRIVSFNVCGCRRAASRPPARCTPLPLDEGDLDVARLFAALREGGYAGDVIVQGHGWRGDPSGFLRRSIAAWHAARTTVPREERRKTDG